MHLKQTDGINDEEAQDLGRIVRVAHRRSELRDSVHHPHLALELTAEILEAGIEVGHRDTGPNGLCDQHFLAHDLARADILRG